MFPLLSLSFIYLFYANGIWPAGFCQTLWAPTRLKMNPLETHEYYFLFRKFPASIFIFLSPQPNNKTNLFPQKVEVCQVSMEKKKTKPSHIGNIEIDCIVYLFYSLSMLPDELTLSLPSSRELTPLWKKNDTKYEKFIIIMYISWYSYYIH